MLRDTGKCFNREMLKQAVLALHEAATTLIYGAAAGAITGDYLHYRLLSLGKYSFIFNDMHRAAMNAITVKKGDLVIVIESTGTTEGLIPVIKLAKKQKARILMISSTLGSPVGRHADMLLVAARPEDPLSADSLSVKVGVMLLVEVLIRELTLHANQYTTSGQDITCTTLPMII